MAITFYYTSMAGAWIIFFICIIKRSMSLRYTAIAVTAAAYSLFYEILLGGYAKLYYYINPDDSLLYLIISSVLLYPVIDVIYTMFIPRKALHNIIYTVLWIILMLIFEIASLYTKTIVLTGWKVFPWSVITYMVTFLWTNGLHGYLKKRGL